MSYEDDIFEQNLCHIRRCYVYKIPPRNTGMGYRAAGWTNQIWFGTLNVVLRGKTCYIELVDDRVLELINGLGIYMEPVPMEALRILHK